MFKLIKLLVLALVICGTLAFIGAKHSPVQAVLGCYWDCICESGGSEIAGNCNQNNDGELCGAGNSGTCNCTNWGEQCGAGCTTDSQCGGGCCTGGVCKACGGGGGGGGTPTCWNGAVNCPAGQTRTNNVVQTFCEYVNSERMCMPLGTAQAWGDPVGDDCCRYIKDGTEKTCVNQKITTYTCVAPIPPPSCAAWVNIKINGCTLDQWNATPRDAACKTTSSTVTLNLSKAPNNTATHMRFANAGTGVSCNDVPLADFTNWQLFNTIKY